MEQATVARKDRKIEELQAELQRFEVRLKEAVRAKTTAETERYEVFEVCKKERVQYTEIALQATTERDAMSSSIKRIEESYGTQVKDIRKLIKDQAKQQNHTFRLHHDKCKKYDKEIADLTQKYERVEYQYRTYKERQESVFKDIKKKALDNEEKNQELQEKATELVGNLKWALNVNRDVRRPDDEEKKPPG
jgi:molecular chaperone GrpE (heat shock protein)